MELMSRLSARLPGLGRPSVGNRLAGMLLAGLGLALALIVVGVSITDQLHGEAEAINEAGKLRMQAYRIGHNLTLAADSTGERRQRLWERIREDVAAYDRRLAEQAKFLDQGFPASISLPRDTEATLADIQARWLARKELLPESPTGLDRGVAEAYNEHLAGFVGRVDTYVGHLQESSATKLQRYYLSLLGFTVIAILVGVVSFQRTRHYLTRPLQGLRDCARQLATGDLESCRAPRADTEEVDQLAGAFNDMAEELKSLKSDLDAQVAEQTRSLQHRNLRLAMLYEIASSLQTNLPVEDLLDQALERIVEVTESDAGMVRLVTGDDRMRLVASRGLDPGMLRGEDVVSLDRCLCGQSAREGSLSYRDDLAPCEAQMGGTLPCGREAGMYAVPIKYKDQVLGLFTLFGTPRQPHQQGVDSLLETVANHVGLVIKNRRLTAEAQRTSLMEERNLLAAELHDSIAQCLASVKLQTWMLEEELEKGNLDTSRELVGKVRNGVESGYSNLRELLTHFRTRIDERGLVPALKSLVATFHEQTGVPVYLQGLNHDLELDPDGEIQVFHIVQEALANVRKHAQAENVRIMVQEKDDTYHILVEDDGRGMDVDAVDADDRAHFGLSIMRERAGRLGGRVEIEGEPGEGVQVLLTFPRGRTDPNDGEAASLARVSG
ncbi:MAG: ATP-binding protein [Thiohalospira sp.]|uniref:ATP-binding protein n=1 Tax=Thiohalorhabdus sp. TaxID=3094134 RepID=UPI003980C03C